jgi:hypothetical protein
MVENQQLMQKYVQILDKNQEQVRARMQSEQDLQLLRQETIRQVTEVKDQLSKVRQEQTKSREKSKQYKDKAKVYKDLLKKRDEQILNLKSVLDAERSNAD